MLNSLIGLIQAHLNIILMSKIKQLSKRRPARPQLIQPLVQLIRSLGLTINRLQKSRQNLCRLNQFDIASTFRMLDRGEKGWVSPWDLQQFFKENKLKVSQPELYLIFKSFDKNRIGKLGLQEYNDIVLPLFNLQLQKVVLNRLSNQQSHSLVIKALSDIFSQMLEGLASVQKARAALLSHQNYKLSRVKQLLGLRDELQLVDFIKFCKDHNLEEQLSKAIFLLIDQTRRGTIDSTTLMEFINPFQKFPYDGYAVAKRSRLHYQQLVKEKSQPLVSKNSDEQHDQISAAISNYCVQSKMQRTYLSKIQEERIRQIKELQMQRARLDQARRREQQEAMDRQMALLQRDKMILEIRKSRNKSNYSQFQSIYGSNRS